MLFKTLLGCIRANMILLDEAIPFCQTNITKIHDLTRWNYSAFQQNKPYSPITSKLRSLHSWVLKLCLVCSLQGSLIRWLECVEQSYMDNPYHNCENIFQDKFKPIFFVAWHLLCIWKQHTQRTCCRLSISSSYMEAAARFSRAYDSDLRKVCLDSFHFIRCFVWQKTGNSCIGDSRNSSWSGGE